MEDNTDRVLDDVFDVIQDEFDFAKKRWGPSSKEDANKPVEVWICWMSEYLDKARKCATESADKKSALHNIRKVANLAITCLHHRGCPSREEEEQEQLQFVPDETGMSLTLTTPQPHPESHES